MEDCFPLDSDAIRLSRYASSTFPLFRQQRNLTRRASRRVAHLLPHHGTAVAANWVELVVAEPCSRDEEGPQWMRGALYGATPSSGPPNRPDPQKPVNPHVAHGVEPCLEYCIIYDALFQTDLYNIRATWGVAGFWGSGRLGDPMQRKVEHRSIPYIEHCRSGRWLRSCCKGKGCMGQRHHRYYKETLSRARVPEFQSLLF